MSFHAIIRPLVENPMIKHGINAAGGLTSVLTVIGFLSPIVGVITGLVLLGYYALLFYERPTIQAWLQRRRDRKAGKA